MFGDNVTTNTTRKKPDKVHIGILTQDRGIVLQEITRTRGLGIKQACISVEKCMALTHGQMIFYRCLPEPEQCTCVCTHLLCGVHSPQSTLKITT